MLYNPFVIPRRKTRRVVVGSVGLGSGCPIAIQSMCQTRTEDIKATVAQILELEREGCEIIRVAVPNFEAAAALKQIKKHIHIPLVADIHFDFRLALESIKYGADKIRINPGNIGGFARAAEILAAAKKAKTAIRLGVNAGSLEQDLWDKYGRPSPSALVESALRWVKIFEKNKFRNFVISLKSSDVLQTVRAYQLVADKCDYPLHLGITEAGLPPYGGIKSAIGIGALLLQGIGDTIRVSTCVRPVEAVRTAKQILKSLHLYNKESEMIVCPTCGRTEIDVRKIARQVEKELVKLKKPVKVSVMGCIVNGPGEAREADFGIAGGRKRGAIFRKGKIIKWAPENKLVSELIKLIKT